MIFLLNEHIAATAEQIGFVQALAQKMGKQFDKQNLNSNDIEDYCYDNDVDMLFVSCRNDRQEVQQWLNACRNLRIPYGFLTDTMRLPDNIKTLLMPVSMLEEEVYKAQIAVHIARFNEADTILLKAHDYGSKAVRNTQKIQTLYEKFLAPTIVEEAKKDSFGVVTESADRANELSADMLILTASREYGLDDIIFGPPERHAIRHSSVPVLLLNPRGDLFALCD